jgi:hypothetical protein
MWKDPRFAALIDKIGLPGYWKRSASLPDYQAYPAA